MFNAITSTHSRKKGYGRGTGYFLLRRPQVMTMENRESYILGEMKISKAFWTLALPAILTMIAKSVYSAVDTMYIGFLGNNAALAAVGIVSPLLVLLQSFETVLSQGICVLVGRKLGEGKKEEADSIVSTTLATSIGFGIFFCCVSFLCMDPLLKLFGASAEVLPYARQYGVWVFVSILFTMPAACLNNAARGESAVKVASNSILIGTLLNVILDPIFIFDFGLGLGVAGASIATTISQAVSLLCVASYYIRGKSLVKIRFSAVHHHKAMYRNLVSIGLPMAVFQSLISGASAFTNSAMAGLPDGDIYITAYSVIQKLVLLVTFIFLGLIQGLQPILAFSAGAKNGKRFREGLAYSAKRLVLVALSISAACFFSGKWIMSLFSPDPSVTQAGELLLRSQTIFCAMFAMSFLIMVAFQALGKGVQGIIIAISRQGLLYIPLVTILPRFFGFNGVLAAQPIADLLSLILVACMFPQLKRLTHQLEAEKLPEGSQPETGK